MGMEFDSSILLFCFFDFYGVKYTVDSVLPPLRLNHLAKLLFNFAV